MLQVLLSQIKEKAKSYGVELRGRLFCTVDNLGSSSLRTKNPEKENINKVLKLEHKVNAQLEPTTKEKESPKTSEGKLDLISEIFMIVLYARIIM